MVWVVWTRDCSKALANTIRWARSCCAGNRDEGVEPFRFANPTRWSATNTLPEQKPVGRGTVVRFLFSQAERSPYIMTSECKGGGKFVGKWSVSVRNTTSCPVCRAPQSVKPYGGRYKIADHRQPEGDKQAQPARES